MKRPFELDRQELNERLEEMVDITMSDLGSEFMLMPIGKGFLRYEDFRTAYEVLKRQTSAFTHFTEKEIRQALLENSRTLCVLRAILGMTPPEWAELARTECDSDITQGAARSLDKACRDRADHLINMESRYQRRFSRYKEKGGKPVERTKGLRRMEDLVKVAIHHIRLGVTKETEDVIHRLSKFDTRKGLQSLRYAAKENVPYAVLLYERFIGRPFAAHRDAVSELVGEVMENAIEERLRKAGVTYRKTGRAERIPGFGQAPDFCIPDEINPAVVIEAKITSDDGTARDKVARIKELETQRRKHVKTGRPSYEVVACIDGRGFRERREDMRQMLLRLNGKVFTTASLDQLITHTRIRGFVTQSL
ncbi:MAG: hypothetical protein SWH78_16060 [Thermodesulfobacteriota bacterium]|nr:hypothetical protein [Thermodesulfobacteriota bacterium]